ncbi:MAG: hypothetical protein GY864_12095 [Desulfobacterales bacterium]|nr:hypothetical protein [Desulfobacterales bacterium]
MARAVKWTESAINDLEEYIEIAAIIDPMKLGNGIEGILRFMPISNKCNR